MTAFWCNPPAICISFWASVTDSSIHYSLHCMISSTSPHLVSSSSSSSSSSSWTRGTIFSPIHTADTTQLSSWVSWVASRWWCMGISAQRCRLQLQLWHISESVPAIGCINYAFSRLLALIWQLHGDYTFELRHSVTLILNVTAIGFGEYSVKYGYPCTAAVWWCDHGYVAMRVLACVQGSRIRVR